MLKSLSASVLAAALLALVPSLAKATPLGGALADADFVTSPHAFQNFCVAHPDQCVSRGHTSLVSLSETRLAALETVNRRVNLEIRPSPTPLPGDAYQLGVTAGACNEYAVEKRRRLLAQGWSSAALSLAVVLLPDGRGHLVLTVRTDRGDLVLDNLTARLRTADQTDYTWVKRQSAIHPALWVRLGGYTASRAAKAAASRPAKANAATRSSRSAKISAAAKSPMRIAQTEPAAAGGLNLRGTFGDDAAVP